MKKLDNKSMSTGALALLLMLILGAACAAAPEQGEAVGETMQPPFPMDYAEVLAEHDVVMTSPAKAYNQSSGANLIEGPLMGNGDIGAVAHGVPGKLVINVGKNDVWDRREVPLPRPPLTQAEYVDMVLNDKDGSGLEKLKKISDELEGVYCHCNPTPKPCGQILLVNEALEGAPFHQRLSLYEAVLKSTFAKDGNRAEISTFVDYPQNVIVTRYAFHGDKPLALGVELYRWDDAGKMPQTDDPDPMPTKPTFGEDGKYFWVRYPFPAEPTFPEGFEYVMLGAIKAASYETELRNHRALAKIKGGANEVVEIYISVATSRDAKDPLRQAKRLVDDAMKLGYEKVLAGHTEAWRYFWHRSYIEISDKYLERLWYLNRYFLKCASKRGRVAPGLYGPWITNDHSAWHGDYHYNYNFMQTFWGAYACNTPELAWPYYDFTYRILPMCKREAKEIYNMQGAKYPLTAYPNLQTRNSYPVIPWDRNMCLSAWAAQNFWWHYLYTLDEDFLREKAYPIMVECARFYQDFMKKENDKYVIWPTVSPEHYGTTAQFRLNRNCAIDLALIRFLLKGTIKASRLLDRDAKDRAVWEDMLANLVDYPTYDTGEGVVFVDVDNARPIVYNLPVPVAPVVPGDHIGLHSDPKVLEIATNTARQIKINGNDGFVILPMAWMRLGLKDKVEEYKEMCKKRVRLNGASTYFPCDFTISPVMENVAIAAVINEMLMQSFNGKIRLFPALPDEMSARIANLRTVGAFLVASEIDKGQVKYVKIKSLKGQLCTVYNIWGSKQIVVNDVTSDRSLLTCEYEGEISFATASDHEYLITLRQTAQDEGELNHK